MCENISCYNSTYTGPTPVKFQHWWSTWVGINHIYPVYTRKQDIFTNHFKISCIYQLQCTLVSSVPSHYQHFSPEICNFKLSNFEQIEIIQDLVAHSVCNSVPVWQFVNNCMIHVKIKLITNNPPLPCYQMLHRLVGHVLFLSPSVNM